MKDEILSDKTSRRVDMREVTKTREKRRARRRRRHCWIARPGGGGTKSAHRITMRVPNSSIQLSRCGVALLLVITVQSAVTILAADEGGSWGGPEDEICAQYYGTRKDSVFSIFKCGQSEPVGIDPPGKSATRSPVILVPGVGGSGLDAWVDGDTDSGRRWYCPKRQKKYHIWFSVFEIMTKFSQACQFEELTLPYNATSRSFEPEHGGVHVEATDFGGTKGVDYLERILGVPFVLSTYLSRMVKSFQAAGFSSGTDLRGAPYDFRQAPGYAQAANGDIPKYLGQLKSLIETTYEKNGGRKVLVVAHSMGCIQTLHLLYLMDDSWKQKYVKSFVPIAGPWIGTAKSMRAVLLGTDFSINIFGKSLLDTKLVQGAASTFPGLLWLFPFADQRWEDTVVATVFNAFSDNGDSSHPKDEAVHTEIFTPDNITLLLEKAGMSETAAAFEKIRKVQSDKENELFVNSNATMGSEDARRIRAGAMIPSPGVPVTCIYGKGVPTEESYQFASFSKVLPGLQPLHVGYGDGDGTVSLRSLRVCEEWIEPHTSTSVTSNGRETLEGQDIRGNRVTVKVFHGAEHEAIVDLPSVITEVLSDAISDE